jgi:hypothetical protein
MTEIEYSRASEATALCKSCGLCCTGHLFSWVRLKATELPHLQKLGINVIRSDPRQRGFTQPCPLWDGQCTIYESHDYPRGCDSYKCKLLRKLLDESVTLPKALKVIKGAKEKIHEVDSLLPTSSNISFRERLVTYLESGDGSKESQNGDLELQQKAHALLILYRDQFGVNDLVNNLDEMGEKG